MNGSMKKIFFTAQMENHGALVKHNEKQKGKHLNIRIRRRLNCYVKCKMCKSTKRM